MTILMIAMRKTDSNVSENRVKPRRGRRKALADSVDTDQPNEITTEMDPPSSPSELGKSKCGSTSEFCFDCVTIPFIKSY